jgi:hypothetical protein
MPLNTDFNISPYYDDFDKTKGFAKILFKPGVSVQVRELNQLQTILNDQMENLANNLFKKGTIIEGCGLTYFSIFPYVKLKDSEVNGAPVNVSSYEGMTVKNSVGLEALVVKTADGFESQNPDLNTLFVKYTNSGNNGNTFAFSANQVLTVYDKTYPIFKYDISDGSSAFSNNDSIVVVSAIAIQNSSGGSVFPAGAFANGHIIQNNVANLQIIETDSTTNNQVLILRVKPLADDLKTANSVLWTFREGETIRNANTANTANVVAIIGSSAAAVLVTDSLGKIVSIEPTNLGSGYYIQPHVTVSITSNSSITTSAINQLNVAALNFKASVSTADSSKTPIGTGYGVKVAPGVIYQKGFFSRVNEQTLVVNKYSNTAFDAVVGFDTKEQIINSNQDNSLFDNATGSPNFSAPGSDRLKLTPELVVLTPTQAQANVDFLPIIEITDGVPFRQRSQTVYSVIADEMAKRTYEESGNYVINQFNVLAKDEKNLANTASTFKVVVDPGTAYIKGYRVSTTGNFSKSVNKGTDTVNLPTAKSRVAYGSFIKINNVGGVFQFNLGDVISLYDTAKNFIASVSNNSNAITAPSGNAIGSARIRGMLPGDNDGEWHLYLFDIKMNAGKNFIDTRSVYYNSTKVAVADTVLESNNTILRDVGSGFNGLLVKNLEASKSANSITYTYRTFGTSKQANTTGYITLTPGASEIFPYSGTLVSAQRKEFMIVPDNNYQAQSNAAGTVTFTSTTANVTGSGTAFLTSYRAGDYIKVANSSNTAVAKILNVANDTFMTLTANAPLTITNTSYLYFPNNVPISMTRDGRSIVVETNNSITIYIGNTVATTAGSATNMDVSVAYNITKSGVNPDAKLIKRNIYSRIVCSNNLAKTSGPWPLGTSDVFRMSQVIKANGASRTITFSSETAVSNTDDFITISSNPFANGDSLVYSNTSGTAIGGLSNNTTYYVVAANSTGVKLASTRNGSAIDITAVSGGGNHSLVGSPIYFTETTNDVSDVTNEFYIDHRQSEDMLDISHLVRRPNYPSLSNNDVLLVKYDAFTSTPGVKTVSSYSVNDTANVATMGNTSINTLEIPEVWGINGQYYDLRDQFDFRPTVANTIPLTSEVSNTSIVNPIVPTFSNKFTASEKYFPVSDADLTANVVYYLGRTDRVVVGVNENIDVIKGYAGKEEPPPAPSDTITLQLLEIPPYPSLPKAMSQDMIALADTKVYNGKGSQRIFEHTVTTPIDANKREILQTKNYKMKDIASLERRVSDIEYYVSYTIAETLAKTRFIPSTLSGGTDRFKVGFFVDTFSNYQYSEVLDPEFNSTIEDERLTAHIEETVIELRHESSPNIGDSIASVDYVEVTAYKQIEATELEAPVPEVVDVVDTVITPGVPTTTTAPIGTVEPPVVVQQIVSEIKTNKNTNWSSTRAVYDDWNFTMSKTAGPVEIYMNHRARFNAIVIEQAESENGPWVEVINSNGALAVTQNDVLNKGISSLLDNVGYWKLGVKFLDTSQLVPGTSIYWWREHQKFIFSHNPDNGLYYRVRVYKGGVRDKASPGKYEYKIFYPADFEVEKTYVVKEPNEYIYNGDVVDVFPKNVPIGGSNINDPNNQQVWFSQGMEEQISEAQRQNNYNPNYWWTNGYVHTVEVIGLKPNTVHDLYFDGTKATDKCEQIRTTTDNVTGLKTDENGTLKLNFYNDSLIDLSMVNTTFAQDQIRTGLIPSVKEISVSSADMSSVATSIINVSPWLSNLNAETDTTESVYNLAEL